MNQKSIAKPNFRLAALFLWIFLITVTFGGSSWYLLSSFDKASPGGNLGFYGPKSPQVMGAAFEAQSADPRPIKIERVFERYKCPLVGKANFIVQKADEYDIPYWLVAAVSFQESGCGKKTPNVPGIEETYNAWGYGVFGGKVRTFENWEEGIETLSKYFSKNFFSKGVTDPCEIMKTYTPPSSGSWCAGVKYFGQLIENFETE